MILTIPLLCEINRWDPLQNLFRLAYSHIDIDHESYPQSRLVVSLWVVPRNFGATIRQQVAQIRSELLGCFSVSCAPPRFMVVGGIGGLVIAGDSWIRGQADTHV